MIWRTWAGLMPLLLMACGPNANERSEEESLSIDAQQKLVAPYRATLSVEGLNAQPMAGTQGWVVKSAKWPSTKIPVCWEAPQPRHAADRKVVEEALVASWEAASAIDFTGFETCVAAAPGIHVAVSDAGAYTDGVGKEVSGMPSGMNLNFDYKSWNDWCNESSEQRLNCIRANAVHEFGHAIGFVHEHNRHDTPLSCMKPHQGPDGDTILTPWDPDSIMNYCNDARWKDGGKLSAGDKSAVEQFYGNEI